MAVNRQLNTLGQMRVDVPHLRSVESSICYDFDAIGLLITGGVPCVVKGFDVVSPATTVGLSATSFSINTAGGRLVHPSASDSGSFFQVPLSRANETLNTLNTRLQGSWTPNTVNYIGIDLLRSADNSTSESVRFLNTVPNTESSRVVPLGRTLDYVITISSQTFSGSPSIAPLYIVTTDANNTITNIVDARNLLFRNGAGGDSPTVNQPFGWPGGRNEANPALATVAGDRSIKSLKQWMNATMTRLQEIGGGEYWYSLTADRNVRMTAGGIFASNGESFEWDGTNLHWKSIAFLIDNSTATINQVADQLTSSAGLTNLADGECLFVDLDRTANKTVALSNALSAQKAPLATLGGSTVPGQRWIIAIRSGTKIFIRDQSYPVGSAFQLATTTVAGMIRTTINANGSITDPVAVGLADSAYYTATCGGLSHNTDLGVTTLLSANDIVVGRGSSAGDQNVIITTNSTYSTHIRSSSTPNGDLLVDSIPLTIQNQCHYDGTKAWTIEGITILPLAPHTDGSGNPHIKYFCKATKVWKTPCRLLDNAHSWTYNSSNTILTATGYGALSVDGVAAIVGDRILVNNPSNAFNGIYVVVQIGDGSHYAIMQRADDAGSPYSNQALGYGYDLFAGSAVKVTAGGSYAGLYFMLNVIPKAGEPALDGSEISNWVTTDNITNDQMCVMWMDGSFTTIASGPDYTVG
jgi:hypothetical protein